MVPPHVLDFGKDSVSGMGTGKLAEVHSQIVGQQQKLAEPDKVIAHAVPEFVTIWHALRTIETALPPSRYVALEAESPSRGTGDVAGTTLPADTADRN